MSIYDEMRNDIEVLYGRGECEYNVYSDMVDYIDEAETDYDRLVDVLHEVETEAVKAYRCLQQDCATATNSSEHFFQKWWHAECEEEKLKDENAKLRELCEGMLVCYEPCNEHLDARTDCPMYDENEPFRCKKTRLLRELGIGVKE